MSLVKFPDHAIHGNWSRSNDKIQVAAASNARIVVPVALNGNYELRGRFARRSSESGGIFFTVPVDDGHVRVYLDLQSGGISFIGQICELDEDGSRGSPGRIQMKSGPISEGPHDFSINVNKDLGSAKIVANVDRKPLIWASCKPEQLNVAPNFVMPIPFSIGIGSNNWSVGFEGLELEVRDDSPCYLLQEDWKNPLSIVDEEPSEAVKSECFEWNEKFYFVSATTLSLVETQRLAYRLRGRMLTISSDIENDLIRRKANGKRLWLSAWCATDRVWKDERNRPLQYFGKWAIVNKKKQPDNFGGAEWWLENMLDVRQGWNDMDSATDRCHACIEWGEEYPEAILESN